MTHEDINKEAPEGYIYVCAACGKQSPTRSGWNKDNKYVAERGWDSSCFLHSVIQEKVVADYIRKQTQIAVEQDLKRVL